MRNVNKDFYKSFGATTSFYINYEECKLILKSIDVKLNIMFYINYEECKSTETLCNSEWLEEVLY